MVRKGSGIIITSCSVLIFEAIYRAGKWQVGFWHTTRSVASFVETDQR